MGPILFAEYIGIVESSGRSNVSFGDDGRAMGRFQVHPDWLWTWAKKYSLEPKLGETWDAFVERVVEAFGGDHLRSMPPSHVAMYFHLGHPSNPTDSDWDIAYAARWFKATRSSEDQ